MAKRLPHVLVVESNAVIAGLLSQTLAGAGVSSATVATGDEAQVLLAGDDFNVVLIDRTPGSPSSYELWHSLRRDVRAPLLMVTRPLRGDADADASILCPRLCLG